MGDEKVLFLLLFGLAGLILSLLGILMICTDLSGMFCYYKNGGIYAVRFDRRLAEDTPQNRRRISRRMGLFFIGVVCLSGLFLVPMLLR